MSTATFGTARHPFRATLPLRTLRRLPRHEPEVQARLDARAAGWVQAPASVTAPALAPAAEPAARRPFITTQDVKDFLIAYVACFMAVSAFLS